LGGTGASAAGAQAPNFAESVYAQFEQQPPWYQQTGPLHRNPVSRVMLMTCIFVVGAVVGLSATWWMSEPTGQPPGKAAIKQIEPVNKAPSATVPGVVAGGGGAAASAVNPGELPYDGKPPAASNDAPSAAVAMPKERTTSRELPPVDSPPSAAKTKPEPEVPVAIVPPPLPEKAEKVAPEKQETTQTAAPTDTVKPPAKAQETKVAKAPPRYRTPQSIAKDREIERIQQQADEELKKKSRSRAVTQTARAGTDAAPSSSAGRGSKRPALARCERDEDSLIGRELCKWKVCSGMWGENGCPSYERQASFQ
jgi:hypothetical protein